MRRVLIAVAALVAVAGVVVAAVVLTGGEEPAPSEDTATEPSPETEEEPEPIIAPLTGEEIDDEAILEQPVVALKVDNAERARPPVGLAEADVVFTELVEGGTTRFIALYHSQLPDTVGPVRSGRDVDAQILPSFSAVFGISGAAEPTYDKLRGADLLVFEEGQAEAFRRDSGRPRPHNLFASPEALQTAGSDLPPAEQPWPFDAEATAEGQEATEVSLTFSPSYRASWQWDGGQRWLRSQEGATHTGADGDHLAATNVVIARVQVFAGGGTDAGGNPVPEVEAVGEGDALVLRDGQALNARWRKSSPGADFEWLTPEGEPLPLHPGNTWVELVPQSGSVDVAGGAGEG